MTTFFLPSSSSDAAAETEYGALRDHAEASTGLLTRDRRIHEIECRHEGRDCRMRVGEADTTDGRMVAAILQLGRDAYTVHHVPGQRERAIAPMVIRRTDVYSVTDFE
ncbi:MAG TPA: hypothetical protein VG010_03710 [Solirubrobacteraceae bacterium]|jgi:hypothetical protein|nr:hypothetical protein [Solirubrobacteraceae bacterium]